MMYIFKIPSFAVKITCFIFSYDSNHAKEGHSVRMRTLKKEFRRPRLTREENVKISVGESVCKNVDSIMCST
jgi:hypothetical protein